MNSWELPEDEAWDILGPVQARLPKGYNIESTAVDGFRCYKLVSRTYPLVVMVTVARYGDGKRWLHVSASFRDRLPTYPEMCRIKEDVIGADKKAVQVFVPMSEHVNIHPFCLHLWHCVDGDPLPDFTCGTGSI